MSRSSDFQQAQILVTSLPRGIAVPEVSAATFQLPLLWPATFLISNRPSRNTGLHGFDVQRRLDTVRRLPAEIFRLRRSIAGLLIFCGLLSTLFMLSRAVGPLGDAFEDLSKQEASSSTSTPNLAVDPVAKFS